MSVSRRARHMTTGPEQAVLRPVSARDMRIAIGCTPVPIEQTEPWQVFEASQGHDLFGRYVYCVGKKAVAAVALYRYEVAGHRYLWAKHGPVWLSEQTPQREADVRRLLAAEVRRRDRGVVFIRMHARFRADGLSDPMGLITYDRTIVIDLRPRTPEAIAAAMPRDGRRGVRRAERVAREAGAVIRDETGLSREAFDEIYQVLVETSQRDGFRPHPAQVYWDMLTCLGPQHARLFVLRVDGVAHCWDLVTVRGPHATAYYGASSNRSRDFRGAEALDWAVACQLAEEGIDGFDLMGAESSRVPELYSVGRYKRRFAQYATEVDGAWDVPLRPWRYRALAQARELRNRLHAWRAA